VVNAINTKVNSDTLLEIASNPNVKKIIKNEPVVKLMYVNETVGMEARSPTDISWIGEIRKIWGSPTTTGKGVVIAIVDSGIDASIEALQRNGKSVVIDKFTLYGDYVHWHGTAVASCIASQGTDMYPQLTGVAPGVDLLNVEVFMSTGNANYFDILKGWEWVAQWKVDHPDKFVICSNSLGVPASEPGILDVGADNMVLRYGIPMVVASGNEAPKYHICSPGMGRYVLTVGAVDQFGTLASFSCTGPVPGGLKKPDVCALGVDVPAFQPHDTFPPIKSVSGTSFSTPIVAGMMALLYEAHPQYDAQQLNDAIRNGAKHAGSGTTFNNEYGYGIADLFGASTSISSEKPSRYYIYMFAMLPIIAIIIMFYPEIDKKLNLY
jgi:serine protease AprX